MARFIRFAVLSAVTAFILVSCATMGKSGSPEVTAVSENAAVREVPATVSAVPETTVATASSSSSSADEYPGWVFTPSSYDDETYKYFSGSSDITVSDRMARQRAMTDCASSFASWWEQSIETVISTSSSIVDDGGKQSYVQTFETKSKTSSSAVVSGLEAVEMWKDPSTGEVWLLARVPKALIGKTFRSVLDETSALEEFRTDEGAGIMADRLKSSFDELLDKGN